MKDNTRWLYQTAQKPLYKFLCDVCGIGRTDNHFALKTGDKGKNPKHCREVCELAMKLGVEGMKPVTAKYGKTVGQLLEVATGRPRKRQRASDKHLASESAGNILRDLRKAAGMPIGTVSYVPGRIKAPESQEVLADLIKQADEFNAEFEKELEVAAKPTRKRRAPRTRKQGVKKAS